MCIMQGQGDQKYLHSVFTCCYIDYIFCSCTVELLIITQWYWLLLPMILHKDDNVIWIIFGIIILHLSVKIRGYIVHIGLYTPSVDSCENIDQSNNSKTKDPFIGSKFECLPWDCSFTLLQMFIENPDDHVYVKSLLLLLLIFRVT